MRTDTPYELAALWGQGDLVSRGTLILLGLMSAARWSVLVVTLIEQNRHHRHAKQARGFAADLHALLLVSGPGELH